MDLNLRTIRLGLAQRARLAGCGARCRMARRSALPRTAGLALALLLVGAQPLIAGELRGALNLNAASVEQLILLPGVGEARASAIVALRKQLGGFKRVEQLTDVRGIGERSLERLRPYLVLKGETTLVELEDAEPAPSRKQEDAEPAPSRNWGLR
ncbi:MAG: ComEA family DNA-binding protein [Deltaproteobacteria bacterium]|nr:ComEA family DNA-binding protein [Deltaproteobacteria bacterium]